MKTTARVVTAALFFSLCSTVQANKSRVGRADRQPGVIDTTL